MRCLRPALALLLLLTACRRDDKPEALGEPPASGRRVEPPPVVPETFPTDAEIPPFAMAEPKLSPAVQAAIDAQRGAGRVESSHVGVGGTPSKLHEAMSAALNGASKDELRSLAFHPDTAIRVYALHRYIDQHGASAADLAPLLRDTTTISTTSGCIQGSESVAHIAVEALCNQHDAPGVTKVLRAAVGARLEEGVRESALGCVSKSDSPEARALLHEHARTGSAHMRRLSLRLLVHLAPGERESLVAPFTADPDREVRMQSAELLAEAKTPSAKAALERMMSDSAPGVSSRAALGYADQPGADIARVRAFVSRLDDKRASSFVSSLAMHDAPDMMPLVNEHVERKRDRLFVEQLMRQKVNPALVPVVQGWIDRNTIPEDSLMEGQQGRYTRQVMFEYLGRSHHPSVRPFLERMASSSAPRDRGNASRALHELGTPTKAP